eukprot:3511000-Rhodomonas_salina.3
MPGTEIAGHTSAGTRSGSRPPPPPCPETLQVSAGHGASQIAPYATSVPGTWRRAIAPYARA